MLALMAALVCWWALFCFLIQCFVLVPEFLSPASFVELLDILVNGALNFVHALKHWRRVKPAKACATPVWHTITPIFKNFHS